MDLVERFKEYADAFEVFYEKGDLELLRPFFTEDAVYETVAEPPFAVSHEGREKVFAGMIRSLETFDKKFVKREPRNLEGPLERDGRVWVRWCATYTAPGVPSLRMDGEETATFEGDRIRRLVDRIPPKVTRSALCWMNQHAGKLERG